MKFPILLPNIFNYPFTYESDIELKIGDFVEVPFGKVTEQGHSPNLAYPLLAALDSPGLPGFRPSITVPPASTTPSRRRSRCQRKNCPQSRDRRSGG